MRSRSPAKSCLLLVYDSISRMLCAFTSNSLSVWLPMSQHIRMHISCSVVYCNVLFSYGMEWHGMAWQGMHVWMDVNVCLYARIATHA